MNIKKLTIGICLVGTMTAHAAIPQFQSFFTANSTTQLKNSDDVTVQVTNAQPLKLINVPGFWTPQTGISYFIIGNNYPSLAYTPTAALVAYSTNYINGVTNSGGIGTTGLGYTNITQVGPMISSYNPLGYQLYGSNEFLIQYVSGVSNSAGNTVAGPFQPVDIANSDANGVINTNIVFVFGIAGDSTTVTNSTNVISFVRSYDGNVYDMINSNTVSITGNGTNEVIGSYQPSAMWIAGVKKVAINYVGFGTNFNSTNTFLVKAGVSAAIP